MPSDLPTNTPENVPHGEDPRSKDPEGGPSDGAVERLNTFRIGWWFYLILASAGVIWIGASQGSIPLALFIDQADWWLDVVLGATAGLGLVALWNTGRQFLPALRDLEEVLARQIGPLSSSEALALALISGFAEELFFRGAMQTSWGWGWATLIFTLMHFGSGRVFRWWTLFAFIAALVFGGLTLYRGTILAAIVAHIVVNSINLRRLGAGMDPGGSRSRPIC